MVEQTTSVHSKRQWLESESRQPFKVLDSLHWPRTQSSSVVFRGSRNTEILRSLGQQNWMTLSKQNNSPLTFGFVSTWGADPPHACVSLVVPFQLQRCPVALVTLAQSHKASNMRRVTGGFGQRGHYRSIFRRLDPQIGRCESRVAHFWGASGMLEEFLDTCFAFGQSTELRYACLFLVVPSHPVP